MDLLLLILKFIGLMILTYVSIVIIIIIFLITLEFIKEIFKNWCTNKKIQYIIKKTVLIRDEFINNNEAEVIRYK